MSQEIKPLKNIYVIILLSLVTACAVIPTTKIYVGESKSLPSSLEILPFKNRTSGDNINENVLLSLQEKLVNELKSIGRFDNIIKIHSLDDKSVDAVVECVITQFDIGARRMAVATEVTDVKSGKLLMRMVTHSELVSIAWPIDYIGVMNNSGSQVIKDIAKSLSR